jgi:hypothetical protein
MATPAFTNTGTTARQFAPSAPGCTVTGPLLCPRGRPVS